MIKYYLTVRKSEGRWVTHEGKHVFIKDGKPANPQTSEDHKKSSDHFRKQRDKHQDMADKLKRPGTFESGDSDKPEHKKRIAKMMYHTEKAKEYHKKHKHHEKQSSK